MPGLKDMRSKSLFGLSYVNMQFDYGFHYLAARQEVINRMSYRRAAADGDAANLAAIADRRDLAVRGDRPQGLRKGNDLYSLNDLRSVEDWTLEREFRRIPGIADVVSFGGTVKRYEIQPDPDRLKRYGITLDQLQNAIAASNDNVSGDYLVQGESAAVVRGMGLIGRGRDPMQHILGMKPPKRPSSTCAPKSSGGCKQIRQIVLNTTNNLPIRVDDVVEGGPAQAGRGNLEPRRGRQQSDPAGKGGPQPSANGNADGDVIAGRQGQRAVGRRRRSRAGPGPAAQGSRVAADSETGQSQDRGTERHARPPAAGSQDRDRSTIGPT